MVEVVLLLCGIIYSCTRIVMVLHTMYGVTFEEIKMLYLKLYFGPRYFA